MGAAQIIRGRRLELGLSEIDVANRLGLTVSAIGDIELRDDEIETAVSLKVAKHACNLLGLSLAHVLGISQDESLIPAKYPSKMMIEHREQKGYTRRELADEVGFEEEIIKLLETVSSTGSTLPIFLFKDIESVLGLPEGSLVLANWD